MNGGEWSASHSGHYKLMKMTSGIRKSGRTPRREEEMLTVSGIELKHHWKEMLRKYSAKCFLKNSALPMFRDLMKA